MHVFSTAALIKVVRFRIIIDYFHLEWERASEKLLEFSISYLELRRTNTIGTVQQERRLMLSLLGIPEQFGEVVEIVGPSLVEVG
jgi:hypothetical protein